MYLPAGLSGVRMRKKTEGQAADKKADCTDGAGTGEESALKKREAARI